MVQCWSIHLINTLKSKSIIDSLDQPLINTWLTLSQCLGWHSIYTPLTSRPTISQVWPNVWIIFLCSAKKIPLTQWVWGMLWAGQWMSDWVSEFVRDVWNNNQIGATINNQSNWCLYRVNHVCEDFFSNLEWPSLLFNKQKQVFSHIGLIPTFLILRL